MTQPRHPDPGMPSNTADALTEATAAELARLRSELHTGARPLSDLWHERAALWQTLGWDRAQLRLWLRCLPGIVVHGADPAEPAFGTAEAAAGATRGSGVPPEQRLGERIAEILAALGKPAPPALIRTKLPPELLVTDALIRSAAREHPRLALGGPLIRLK